MGDGVSRDTAEVLLTDRTSDLKITRWGDQFCWRAPGGHPKRKERDTALARVKVLEGALEIAATCVRELGQSYDGRSLERQGEAAAISLVLRTIESALHPEKKSQ